MGLFHHGLAMPTLTFEFGSILVASFGLMLLWGGIYHAHISTLFGRPEATISLELVKPGSQFNFELRRKVIHRTKIEYVGVYLVLRETISFHDVNDPATRIIDRLFQKYTQPGRKYNVHDSVYVSCQFQIPENYRQLANPYTNELNVKVQQMWVIKVRVHLEKNKDVWEIYGLEDDWCDVNSIGTHKPDPNLFDVMLTRVNNKNMLAIMKAIDISLPHLREGQVGDLYFACPCLLLERITWDEASKTKELLEELSAEVDILPTGI